MALILKYFDLQQYYEHKYGERVIVLIQIGEFYEMYEYDPNNCASPDRRISKYRPGQVYDQKIGRAVDAAAAIDAELTFQNGNLPYSIHNPNKAGFPLVAYERKRKILLVHNFVIVRVDQIDSIVGYNPNDPTIIPAEKNGKPRRVAEIISPATELDVAPPAVGTNNILSIYIDYQKGSKSFEDFVLTCGLASIDVTTGLSKVVELYSRQGDHVSAIQEIMRYLLAQQPREIIININNIPQQYVGPDGQNGAYANFLKERLELNNYPTLTILCNEVNPEYLKLTYQRQFFQRIFFPNNLSLSNGTDLNSSFKQLNLNPNQPTLRLNVIQTNQPILKTAILNHDIFSRIGLERMEYGRISYLLLLQYCYEHNQKIIQHIKVPDTSWLDSEQHLILTHNAAKQLHLSPQHGIYFGRKKKSNSLFEILNFTSTRLGYRLLHDRLFNPLTEIKQLNLSYQLISSMITGSIDQQPMIEVIELSLRGLPDLERYQHKLMLGDIKPKELTILYRGYLRVVKIYGQIYYLNEPNFKTLLFDESTSQSFNHFLQQFNTMFDVDKLECCRLIEEDQRLLLDFVDNPLRLGAQPELVQIQTTLDHYEQQLKVICDYLNQFLKGCRGNLLDYHHHGGKTKSRKEQITGTAIMTTKAKAEKLNKLLPKIDVNICGELQFIPVHSERMIHSVKIQQLCMAVEQCRTELRARLYQIYRQFLVQAKEQYHFYEAVAKFIAKLDFIKSAARAAVKYNYYQPTIVDFTEAKNKEEGSFLEIDGLRHPIIEQLIDGEYITNYLRLGDYPGYPCGLLMYGANSTGKSSLAQALALVIIMAQAGLWTAGKLRYRPYYQIITRLSGHDDITKGQSSFMIEMEELRIILRNADRRSLVIGDELCRGTESLSGTGLTVAALEELSQRGSSFIFSTHMHHLVQTKYLRALAANLQISHLSLSYNNDLQELVINRKIQAGEGSTIYGIEVAKSMGLDQKYIQRASQIRKEVAGEAEQILSTQKSTYNSELYKEPCLICGVTEQVDTHHIIPQKLADKNGFIGDMPKNVKSNLVHLCQSCHHYVHQGGLILESCQTPTGQAITIKANEPKQLKETSEFLIE